VPTFKAYVGGAQRFSKVSGANQKAITELVTQLSEAKE
jgi:hypothetical protein